MSVTLNEVVTLIEKFVYIKDAKELIAAGESRDHDKNPPKADWQAIRKKMWDATSLHQEQEKLKDDFLKYVHELRRGNPTPEDADKVRDMYDHVMKVTDELVSIYEECLRMATIHYPKKWGPDTQTS